MNYELLRILPFPMGQFRLNFTRPLALCRAVLADTVDQGLRIVNRAAHGSCVRAG
jgi:hypothetical protein